MNKHLVAVTPNGTEVYVDLVASLAGKQVGLQPHLLTLAQEIIAQQNLKGETLTIETHMGRFVGTTGVVKTSEKDAIFYAKPVGSQNYRRYVKNHSYTPTHYLTLVLQSDGKKPASYDMTDISPGRACPEMPNETKTTRVSRTFWADHAYVWEPRSCQLQTITKECPWEDVAKLSPAA